MKWQQYFITRQGDRYFQQWIIITMRAILRLGLMRWRQVDAQDRQSKWMNDHSQQMMTS